MNTVIMDVVRTGLAAAAFILVMKWLFVGHIRVPGLSDAVAAI